MALGSTKAIEVLQRSCVCHSVGGYFLSICSERELCASKQAWVLSSTDLIPSPD